MFAECESCDYPDGNTYRCFAHLVMVGGIGPFVVTVRGAPIGTFASGQSITFQLVAQRCNNLPFTVRVHDNGSNSDLTRQFVMNPDEIGAAFPTGACEL